MSNKGIEFSEVVMVFDMFYKMYDKRSHDIKASVDKDYDAFLDKYRKKGMQIEKEDDSYYYVSHSKKKYELFTIEKPFFDPFLRRCNFLAFIFEPDVLQIFFSEGDKYNFIDNRATVDLYVVNEIYGISRSSIEEFVDEVEKVNLEMTSKVSFKYWVGIEHKYLNEVVVSPGQIKMLYDNEEHEIYMISNSTKEYIYRIIEQVVNRLK